MNKITIDHLREKTNGLIVTTNLISDSRTCKKLDLQISIKSLIPTVSYLVTQSKVDIKRVSKAFENPSDAIEFYNKLS